MELKERATNIMRIVSDLYKSNSIEEVLDVRAMSDGYTVFVRGTDGNAYEIEIRPASLAKGHDEIRKSGQYAERKQAKQDKIRKGFGM